MAQWYLRVRIHDFPCPVSLTPSSTCLPTCPGPLAGLPVQQPSIWLHLSSTTPTLLCNKRSPLPLLEPEIHVESELRPKQETLHTGPESLRSHLPEVEPIGSSRVVQACTSSPSESRNPCMDPPGLSPVPLLEAPAMPIPRKLYTCEQCGLSFDWKSVFVIHQRTHMGGPDLKRPPPVAWEPAVRRSPGLRGYTCVECGRSFSWKSQLVIHRKSHAGQRRHFCRDCGCSFDWKFQLVIHRKIHQPQGP